MSDSGADARIRSLAESGDEEDAATGAVRALVNESPISLRISEGLTSQVLAGNGTPLGPGTTARRSSRLKERLQEMATKQARLFS